MSAFLAHSAELSPLSAPCLEVKRASPAVANMSLTLTVTYEALFADP